VLLQEISWIFSQILHCFLIISVMKPSKGTLYDSLTNIDGCNSNLKICNTRVYMSNIDFTFFIWIQNRKDEDTTKLQKLLVIVCGYLMFWTYMKFTYLCLLWRVHATCYVVKMDVWWLMKWWKNGIERA
jgi:hypothetical protein